jgi:hypothetical protein
MSMQYRPLKQLRFSDLFDGRLEPFGVRDRLVPGETTELSRCLTDGRNYMWVYSDDCGFVTTIARYGCNAPAKILRAISEEFDTDIVSEYEPQFYGFDTQEEWDACNDKIASEYEEAFYIELLKYVRGEANDIRPGTIGMIEAQIAEKLVAERPELLFPEHKQELLTAIDAIYTRDHCVGVTLSDQEIAAAQLAVAHEDDLPKA